MPKLVRAAVLSKYLEVTQDLGFNPRDVLAVAGLSKAQPQAPEYRIPSDAAVRLVRTFQHRLQDDGCAFNDLINGVSWKT